MILHPERNLIFDPDTLNSTFDSVLNVQQEKKGLLKDVHRPKVLGNKRKKDATMNLKHSQEKYAARYGT